MTSTSLRRVLEYFVRSADRWVPGPMGAQPALLLRARLLILFCTVTLLTCPVFAVSYWMDGQPLVASIILVALSICALLPLLLKRTGSLAIAGNVGTTTYFASQLTVVALAGGYDVGTLYWLAVTPVFGTFLGGTTWGRRWILPVVVAVVAITYLQHEGDLLPQLAHAPMPAFEALGVVILAVLLTAVTAVYEATSERARSEAEAARVRAEEVSRAKGEFLATMSHEIRTPLNGILGMTDVLLLGEQDDERRRRLTVVRDSGAGLLRAVNDVLELSRLEAAGAELHLVAFDPGLLAEDVARLYSPEAEARGLQLEVHRTEPVELEGDREKVRQILSNLLSNAVKYTSQGYVRVVVETSASPEQAMLQVRFHIEDSGPGIDAARQAKIFEPYAGATSWPGRVGPKASGSSTGLGLAISHRLATAMDATLSLRSSVGQGSRFSLEMRLRVLPGTSARQARTASEGHALERSGRVLVVEDNAVNREVARLMLQSRGLSVDLVDDGHSALRALGAKTYDLVLMDCQMPGLDGFDATREIRRHESMHRRTPIVAMTAAVLEGDRERCIGAGMDDYLTKPVTLEALDAVLQRFLVAAGERQGGASSTQSAS